MPNEREWRFISSNGGNGKWVYDRDTDDLAGDPAQSRKRKVSDTSIGGVATVSTANVSASLGGSEKRRQADRSMDANGTSSQGGMLHDPR